MSYIDAVIAEKKCLLALILKYLKNSMLIVDAVRTEEEIVYSHVKA